MENKEKYQSINQSVRYYKVPSSVEKGAALNSLLEKIRNTPEKPVRIIRMNSLIIRIATTAAAAVLVLAVLFVGNRETLTNDSRLAESYRLPDQTRVVLAPGGILTFSERFTNRTVRLSGEGYFEVVPGSKFRVKTTAGDISVLGTRFNVKVSGNDLEVSCYTGKLMVESQKDDQLLGGGQGVQITSSGTLQTDLAGTEFPPIALFRVSGQNIGLENLLSEVEDFFGVTVKYPPVVERYYTGVFETGSLENALILICEPLGLEYSISEDNTVIIKESIQ